LTKPPRLLRRLLELAGMNDMFAVVGEAQSGKSATQAGCKGAMRPKC
jgi:hypothetical protein